MGSYLPCKQVRNIFDGVFPISKSEADPSSTRTGRGIEEAALEGPRNAASRTQYRMERAESILGRHGSAEDAVADQYSRDQINDTLDICLGAKSKPNGT